MLKSLEKDKVPIYALQAGEKNVKRRSGLLLMLLSLIAVVVTGFVAGPHLARSLFGPRYVLTVIIVSEPAISDASLTLDGQRQASPLIAAGRPTLIAWSSLTPAGTMAAIEVKMILAEHGPLSVRDTVHQRPNWPICLHVIRVQSDGSVRPWHPATDATDLPIQSICPGADTQPWS